CKQERAKPSAIGVGVTQPAALQYHDKKILREVLCVRHCIAASADKRENGPPISPAKLIERPSRFLFLTLRVSGGKDQGPPRGNELTRLARVLPADLRVHERHCGYRFASIQA